VRLSKSKSVSLEKKITRFIPQTKVWGFLAYNVLNKEKKRGGYRSGSDTPTTKKNSTIAVPSSVYVDPSKQVAIATIFIFPNPRIKPVFIFAVSPGARHGIFLSVAYLL